MCPLARTLHQAIDRGGSKPGRGVRPDRAVDGMAKDALENSVSTVTIDVAATPTHATHMLLQHAFCVVSD